MTQPEADNRVEGLTIDISIEAGDWADEAIVRPLITSAIEAALDHSGFADAQTEVSVVLTDDASMQEINRQWRGFDKPTNVLSFPAQPLAVGDRPGPMLGDIVLARETVLREATLDGKTVDAHVSHLMVHGLLHLLGHDHEDDDEAEAMERTERDVLARLGIADPYSPGATD